ncbi:phosphoribosylformylglycinamidine cyclo-ligase [bacterium]|nr:phosphoribosylformylglycinamidine cyclo-ligase [bacterium]
MVTPTTYKDAGVDIDEGDGLVDDIGDMVKKTQRPELLGGLGGYAGLFGLDLKKFPEPVLVSSTDGVGTKLKLAFEMNVFNTVGVDLVAMCVNDLVCCGAEPLFFLDYYATGKLERAQARDVIKGIAGALANIRCTLIGGETAEMPGMYAKGEFDLAGFSVGAVNKPDIIDGSKVAEGDAVIGLASSGVHSNGYSLVRKIIEKNNINIKTFKEGLDKPIGEVLLVPTQIYVNPVLELIKKVKVKALAHITGGGIVENLPRVLPNALAARIEKNKIETPAIFKVLKHLGAVPEDEMWRVFNMGVGFVVIASSQDAQNVIDICKAQGYKASLMGNIVKRSTTGVELV